VVAMVFVAFVAVLVGVARPRATPPDVPVPVRDAAVDGPASVVIADAPRVDAPPATTPVRKKPRRRGAPESPPDPVPVVPAPIDAQPAAPPLPTPTPVAPGRCVHTNPAGCPSAEPNVNRPCDAEGVRCIYGTSCCPIVYVCNGGAFEAWFQTCP